jgi:hypothetical protein
VRAVRAGDFGGGGGATVEGGGEGAVVFGVEEADEGTKSLLVRLWEGKNVSLEERQGRERKETDERFFDISINIDTGEPLIAKIRTAVKVDGGDDLHVG